MSDLFLDTNYLHKISYKLARFHKTGKDSYAFRCPLCGDSKKDKGKTRGNFQVYKGQLFSGCYNCNESLPFPAFIKRFAPDEYEDYIVDSFGKRRTRVTIDHTISSNKPSFKSSIKNIDSFFTHLSCINDLEGGHPAKKYVVNRGVTQLDRLYYTSKFKKFCNTVKPNSFKDDKYDTPRLIIPFIDKDNTVFAFQGRSFDKNSKAKYITIKLDENMPKIFGLNTIDNSEPILLLEGPVNTLFINNAVGAAGSNLESYADLFDDPILVFDNDSRNKNIVNSVKSAIQSNRKVVLWDNRFEVGEDINDIATRYGLSPQQITDYLLTHSYSGLMAELKFSEWTRCNA